MTDKTMTIEDGKYTLVRHENGGMEALRYGNSWRDLTGDKLILALVQRIDKLESQHAVRGEAVAEVCAIGLRHRFIRCASLNSLPIGSKLYTDPPPAAGVPDVSPRHPVVVRWRNDALKSAAEIVDRYAKHFPECSGAADDIRAMLSATPSPTIGDAK